VKKAVHYLEKNPGAVTFAPVMQMKKHTKRNKKRS